MARLHYERINCPDCGKFLFETVALVQGVFLIRIPCRQCGRNKGEPVIQTLEIGVAEKPKTGIDLTRQSSEPKGSFLECR